MSTKQLFELAEKFAEKQSDSDVPVGNKSPSDINKDFRDFRAKLEKFYDKFVSELSTHIAEIGGDIFVLRNRGVDPTVWKLMSKIQYDLVEIKKQIDLKEPYTMREPYAVPKLFAEYVLAAPMGPQINDLITVIDEVAQKTNVPDLFVSKRIQHPRVDAIKNIKQLALDVVKFIETNPPLGIPGNLNISIPPPPLVPQEPLKPTETVIVPPDEKKTSPGVPTAKRKLDEEAEKLWKDHLGE